MTVTTFQMCIVLHSLNQLILQTDQLRDNTGEEEPKTNFLYQCHKTFISTGISCPILFSFWGRIFPFPYSRSHTGHSVSLAGLPQNVSSAGSQGPRFPAVLSCWEKGSCGSTAPSRGDAQDDSLHLKVRSPLARNVSPLLAAGLS